MVKRLKLVSLVGLVFISDDTLLFGTNANELMIACRILLYTVAVVLLGVIYSSKPLQRHSSMNILWMVFFVGVSCFTVIYNVDYRGGYALQIVTIILSILIAHSLSLHVFINAYKKCIFWLAFCSLIVFGISIYWRAAIVHFPVIQNYGGVEFYNLFIAAVFSDENIIRNTGIFREPGVYAFHLLVATIFELFGETNPNKKSIFIFTLTMLTTASTAGILLLMLLGFSFFAKRYSFYRVLSITLVIATIFAVYSFAGIQNDNNVLIFSKFQEGSQDYMSYLARLSSAVVPLFMIIKNPVFGVGLSIFSAEYEQISNLLFGVPFSAESASTNTFLNYAAIFGVPMGSAILFGVYRFSRTIAKHKLDCTTIFLVLVLISSSQELRYSLLFNLMIMYGLIVNLSKNKKSLVALARPAKTDTQGVSE